MSKKSSNQNDTSDEASRILKRVEQESETVGTSSMRRVAERVKNHVEARDVDKNEWSEVWGTRIGRSLGLIAFVILVIYLFRTYILHV